MRTELKQIFDEISEDAPWFEKTCLLVGPQTSREVIKDLFLQSGYSDVLPYWTITSIADLAAYFLKKAGITFKEKKMGKSSQADAIEKLALMDFIQERNPVLANYLKDRKTALNIASFIEGLDLSYLNETDLDAFIELYSEKDKNLADFLQILSELWRQGELQCWSNGRVLRTAIELFSDEEKLEVLNQNLKLPEKIVLWGFLETTRLEQSFLDTLVAYGIQVTNVQLENLSKDSPSDLNINILIPHSVFDEFEFMADWLSECQSKGLKWNELAVFVPKDENYKSLALEKIQSMNIPVRDPTLPGAWKEQSEAVWLLDLLKAASSGLKDKDVRKVLISFFESDSTLVSKFLETAYLFSANQGHKAWAKVNEKVPLQAMTLLLNVAQNFTGSYTVEEFLVKAAEFSAVLKERNLNSISELLEEFSDSLLVENRPYLFNRKMRLNRYVLFLEEFLEQRARRNSCRNDDGVWFVSHDQCLPINPQSTFILGSGMLNYKSAKPNPWDWESQKVYLLWEKLNYGLNPEEKTKRDLQYLENNLLNGKEIFLSAPDYDLSGKTTSHGVLFLKYQKDIFKSAHQRAGWLKGNDFTSESKAFCKVEPQHITELRISAFEDYLRCPFIYYARHILKLDDDKSLGFEPDAMSRGSIIHKVLEKLLALNLGELDENAVKVQAKILLQEEAKVAKGIYPSIELQKNFIKKLEKIIDSFLTWEFTKRKKFPSMKPFLLEKEVSLELIPGLKLKGKVDRIDSDGENIIIIDYKTGQPPYNGKELKAPIACQLLLYTQAATIAFNRTPIAAHYLSLGQTKIDDKKGLFTKLQNKKFYDIHARNSGLIENNLADVIDTLVPQWQAQLENLKNGEFSPKPCRPTECRSCNFQSFCGYKVGESDE